MERVRQSHLFFYPQQFTQPFWFLNSDGISHVSGVPESLPGLIACDSNLDIECPLSLNLFKKKNFFKSCV